MAKVRAGGRTGSDLLDGTLVVVVVVVGSVVVGLVVAVVVD